MANGVLVEDNDWQARVDALTLIQAEQIKADSVRLRKAVAAAQKMADEKAEEAKAAKKIASKRVAP